MDWNFNGSGPFSSHKSPGAGGGDVELIANLHKLEKHYDKRKKIYLGRAIFKWQNDVRVNTAARLYLEPYLRVLLYK